MENKESQEYKRFHALEQTNICAVCGANVITIWNGEKSIYELICTHDPKHKGYRRRPTDREIVARGQLDEHLGSGRQEGMEVALAVHPEQSPLMATKDVATGSTLVPEQIKELIAFAKSVDLKAELGHVCLYFGKPYVTIDGYWYHKAKQNLGFMVSCMPMTPAERKSYMVGENDFAFLARALTAGGDELNRGIGIITEAEMNEKSEKHPEHFAAPIAHDNPQIMTEKRATWQLLRKMIPLGVEVASQKASPAKSSMISKDSEADAKLLWE